MPPAPPQAPQPPAAPDAAPRSGDAGLFDTRWRVLALSGEPIKVPDGRRPPQLLLRAAQGRSTWSATVGCNALSGGLTVAGDVIAFKAGMSTLMACPPPLDAIEKRLGAALLATTHWRIQGNRLELRDDAGGQTFLCEAARPE